MNSQLYIFFLVIAIILVAIILFVSISILIKLNTLNKNKDNDQSMALLNQNMQALQSNFQQSLDRTNQAINTRLDNAAKIIGAVSKELGQMSQIGQSLQNFQDLLKNPKLRGGLGEQGLRDMLSQTFPNELYSMQYKFKNGQIVDAAIKIEAGIVPVDAKFPLENFNKILKAKTDKEKMEARRKFRSDFRVHVNAIAKKYILTDEGTVDFALMYIPSETVYYELISNENDLHDYAIKAKVIPTSPNTFFYYLRSIMLGLQGKRISEMSKQILSTLKIIQTETDKFGDNLSVLSRHVTNAKSTMEKVDSDFTRLRGKIDKVNLLEAEQSNLIEETGEADEIIG
ncbi:MAG: DNA recombination protein RmuC [Bacillota bacterium]